MHLETHHKWWATRQVVGENGSIVGEVKNQGAFSSVTDEDGNVTVTVENDDLGYTTVTYKIGEPPDHFEVDEHLAEKPGKDGSQGYIVEYDMITTRYREDGTVLSRTRAPGSFVVYINTAQVPRTNLFGRLKGSAFANSDRNFHVTMAMLAYNSFAGWVTHPHLTPHEVTTLPHWWYSSNGEEVFVIGPMLHLQ